jgi:hypothetical protein
MDWPRTLDQPINGYKRATYRSMIRPQLLRLPNALHLGRLSQRAKRISSKRKVGYVMRQKLTVAYKRVYALLPLPEPQLDYCQT